MPFCSSTTTPVPLCTHGANFVCSSSGIPTCELLGLPSCKNNNVYTPGTCSRRGILNLDSLGVEITFALSFPDVIQLPLNNDEFVGKIGFAFPGSNPSYEIKTLTTNSNIEVSSVDLTDNAGMIFENISFEIIKLDGLENEFILTVIIPEEISEGKAAFTLNLTSGEQLTGEIQIINSLNDLEIITIKNPNKRTSIDKPEIDKLISKASGKKMSLILKGKNFVSRQIFYTSEDSGGGLSGNEELFVINPDTPDPHTAITIFPSSLNAKVTKRIVKKNGKLMKVFIKFSKKITKRTEAVIVVVTPEGITSKSFVISPRKH